MHVCVCVYVYVCVCVCMFVCMCVYVSMYVCMYVIFKNLTISIISLSAVLSIIVQIGLIIGGP